MKEMNIQFHKTRPQNPFDDGAKARLHRMGLLRIDGSVDEATLDALSRAYSGLLFDDLCDTCQNSCEITEILRRLLLHLHSAMRCAMKDIPIWHRMSFSSAAMKNRMMRFWVQQSSTTMLWKLTTVSSLPFSTKRSMAMSFYSRLMPRLPRRISGRKLIEGNCKKLQQLPIFL